MRPYAVLATLASPPAIRFTTARPRCEDASVPQTGPAIRTLTLARAAQVPNTGAAWIMASGSLLPSAVTTSATKAARPIPAQSQPALSLRPVSSSVQASDTPGCHPFPASSAALLPGFWLFSAFVQHQQHIATGRRKVMCSSIAPLLRRLHLLLGSPPTLAARLFSLGPCPLCMLTLFSLPVPSADAS